MKEQRRPTIHLHARCHPLPQLPRLLLQLRLLLGAFLDRLIDLMEFLSDHRAAEIKMAVLPELALPPGVRLQLQQRERAALGITKGRFDLIGSVAQATIFSRSRETTNTQKDR